MVNELDIKALRYIAIIVFSVRFIYFNCVLAFFLFMLTGRGLTNLIILCTIAACFVEYYMYSLMQKYNFDIDEIFKDDLDNEGD